MMAIQYLDYPFDNHKLPFTRMRFELRAQKGKSLSFGLGITVLTMIPLINLLSCHWPSLLPHHCGSITTAPKRYSSTSTSVSNHWYFAALFLN